MGVLCDTIVAVHLSYIFYLPPQVGLTQGRFPWVNQYPIFISNSNSIRIYSIVDSDSQSIKREQQMISFHFTEISRHINTLPLHCCRQICQNDNLKLEMLYFFVTIGVATFIMIVCRGPLKV